jgi:hypothetical protein
MRNKKTHSTTVKKRLDKCKNIFRAYSEIQLRYGESLDIRSDIVEIKANYELKDFQLGDNYSTDFLCIKDNGELMVRECVLKKNLMKPGTIKILDCSLNYWRSKGVKDWGVVLDD